ncbi:MAG: GNAT family protein [Nitriliruptoraceae bacterium]
MAASQDRREVHLRMLVADDAAWVVETDNASATALAPTHGWDVYTLQTDLDEGKWASDAQWAWGVIVGGKPAGFVLVTDLDQPDARMTLRIHPALRGRGVGREVLRQVAEHHFHEQPDLQRLTGRAHERNIPMQRAFNAASFRMEARYRDTIATPDGGYASEWGYALTRTDWAQGKHRSVTGYALHGLTFSLDEVDEGPTHHGLQVRFLQEQRRVIAKYHAAHISDGELAGILTNDLVRYRFVHTEEHPDESIRETLGRGRARLQRREDGRLEIVDQWSDERGNHGRRVLIQEATTDPDDAYDDEKER